MSQVALTQQTINLQVDDTLILWVEAFLVDRKAQNLTPGSIKWYREKITLFTDYCDGQVITRIGEITPDIIRRFLLFLADKGHNPGGVHSAFRSLRAFLLWFEKEAEPDGWKNPIRKVKAPKVPDEPIEPVELDTVKLMTNVCMGNGFTAIRDKALLLFLLDTGTRVNEALNTNITDVDQISGAVLIRQGKGRKPRTVYLGQKARRAVRTYLRLRTDKNGAVWITDEFERLKYGGLRAILERRAANASVPVPSPHDFRRAFALNMLRNGVDLVTLSRLMGHNSLTVLKRYLKQSNVDLREAHAKNSPVDNGGF